jgi:hypothetical protein
MSSGTGSGLNPFNWPDHLRQYRTKNPEEPSARDVQDPETWDDPDPSLRERLTPNTVAQWLVLAAVGVPVLGLLAHLYPVFAPAFKNPVTLALSFLIGTYIAIYLKGRQSGMEAYKKLDKSIVYYGDEIDVRCGEEAGEAGREKLFTPYRNVSYGGFSKRQLLRRDLPYDASKIRSSDGTKDEAGEKPAVDRLNTTTIETDTETIGKVLVTHASGMEYDEFGTQSDRYTALPNEMDEDVADDMNRLIDNFEHQIKSLRQKIEMLQESNEDIRDLRDSQILPQLEQTMTLLNEIFGVAEQQKNGNRRQRSTRSVSDPELNGNGMEAES